MTQTALPPRVGLGGALLLSFNGAVGAAVFALPATLASDVGPWAPWLFPLAGLVMLGIAIPFAKAAGTMPDNGGPAIYGAAFGRLAAFELGWLYYIARTAALAANVHVLVDYLLRWSGSDAGEPTRSVLILGTLALLAGANILGMTRALRLLGGLTLFKTLPLIALAVLALLISPLPALGPPPPLSAMEGSLLLVLYAFVGFENAAVTAGETREAGRTVPRALLLTIGAIVILYTLVQVAFVAAAPTIEAGDKAPLLALGSQLLGPVGALLILVAAVTSLAGNLHGNLAATPRVTHTLAERGDLPRWFAAVHPRLLSPHHSILLMAALGVLLALSGGFVWLAVVSVLSRLVVYAVTVLAWLRHGGRGASDTMMGGVAILLCALLATQATMAAWATLGLLALFGLLLFGLARHPRKKLR